MNPLRTSYLFASEHRKTIIAKRKEHCKKRILETIIENGQATSTQLMHNVSRVTLRAILSELVREGKLRRKRGFDALGRVCIVYTLNKKLR